MSKNDNIIVKINIEPLPVRVRADIANKKAVTPIADFGMNLLVNIDGLVPDLDSVVTQTRKIWAIEKSTIAPK